MTLRVVILALFLTLILSSTALAVDTSWFALYAFNPVDSRNSLWFCPNNGPLSFAFCNTSTSMHVTLGPYEAYQDKVTPSQQDFVQLDPVTMPLPFSYILSVFGPSSSLYQSQIPSPSPWWYDSSAPEYTGYWDSGYTTVFACSLVDSPTQYGYLSWQINDGSWCTKYYPVSVPVYNSDSTYSYTVYQYESMNDCSQANVSIVQTLNQAVWVPPADPPPNPSPPSDSRNQSELYALFQGNPALLRPYVPAFFYLDGPVDRLPSGYDPRSAQMSSDSWAAGSSRLDYIGTWEFADDIQWYEDDMKQNFNFLNYSSTGGSSFHIDCFGSDTVIDLTQYQFVLSGIHFVFISGSVGFVIVCVFRRRRKY